MNWNCICNYLAANTRNIMQALSAQRGQQYCNEEGCESLNYANSLRGDNIMRIETIPQNRHQETSFHRSLMVLYLLCGLFLLYSILTMMAIKKKNNLNLDEKLAPADSHRRDPSHDGVI